MMFTEEDYIPIEQCPLLWRWASASHGNFSIEEIGSIRPLSDSAFDRAWDSFTSMKWDPRVKHETSGDPEEVANWLRTIIPEQEVDLVLLWEHGVGAVVPAELFATRWDDFCYPSSDDVYVWGVATNWGLEYRHYEIFTELQVAG